MKRLNDISWNVTEEEYRNDPALSYSTLAKYERVGFNGLSMLFDKVESPSLTFGSAVDSIITGGKEEFENRFIVANMPNISDEIKSIIKEIKDKQFVNINEHLKDVPSEDILKVLNEHKYRVTWKDTTRISYIVEQGSEYWKLLSITNGKTLLTQSEYTDILNAVNALKSQPQTANYFSDSDDVERYYQLKFKASFEGVDYRCMADLIVVNHKTKTIYPVDLKTSSHFEWDFTKSFTEWLYMIQARLYYRIIEYNLKQDDYFKDFKLENYRFIVVNKRSLTPLVWEFLDTKYYGDLTDTQNNIYRDPFVIGTELNQYLNSKPNVPIGVSIMGTNKINNVFPLVINQNKN